MSLSSKSEDIFHPHHKDINCGSCTKYDECRAIESKHKDLLEELEGNWRAVFEDGKRVDSPIRRCSHAIFDAHCNKFRGKDVLEIGCGPLSEIDYDFCKKHNVRYTGLDPDRLPGYFIPYTFGRSVQNKIFTSALDLFKIKKFPKRNAFQRYIKDYFPSALLQPGSFDLVYGNSTIEHWHENEKEMQMAHEHYRKDIRACYDLLRPGGRLLINCPIYVHGNNIFVYGKVDLIETLFSTEWKSVEFEHWRETHDDLMPYCPKKRKESFKEAYNIDLVNIWILNIIAEK